MIEHLNQITSKKFNRVMNRTFWIKVSWKTWLALVSKILWQWFFSMMICCETSLWKFFYRKRNV